MKQNESYLFIIRYKKQLNKLIKGGEKISEWELQQFKLYFPRNFSSSATAVVIRTV